MWVKGHTATCGTIRKGLAKGAGGALLALGATSAFAAVDVQTRGVIDPVEVYASVTDADGAPLTGLTETDFLITEDGEPRAITGFVPSPASDPSDNVGVSVVFVMDYSLSLDPEEQTAIQDAVTSFVNGMQTGDQVALVKFRGEVIDTLPGFWPVGTDNSGLVSQIEAAYSGSDEFESPVYDAVETALNLFDAHAGELPAGPKVVVLLSDGEDRGGSTTTLEALIDRLNTEDNPVYPIGFGNADTVGANVLSDIARASDTDYVSSNDADALQGLYDELGDTLQNRYTLTYDSAGALDDCTVREVVVTVGSGTATEQSGTASLSRCPNTNYAPTIKSIDERTYAKGTQVSLQIEASDRDDDPLTFSATGLPPGLSINTSTGLISGTPNEIGSYDAKVTVSDGTASSSIAFTISVADAASTSSGGSSGGGGGALGLWQLMLAAFGWLAFKFRRTTARDV